MEHTPLRRAQFLQIRLPPPYLYPSMRTEALSYYDTTPLKATLERLVDFDRINAEATLLQVIDYLHRQFRLTSITPPTRLARNM